MRKLNTNPNVDNSNLVDYPDGRVKDNTGAGDGTPVNERVYGDIHQTVSKLMRLYGITPNDLPDNETNGFQIVDAIRALASKNDYILEITSVSTVLNVPVKLASMVTGEQIVCKASVGLGAETTIKGSDLSVFSFTAYGTFLANEYVRLIKTASGINLVRLGDAVSMDAMVSDLLYLKKASQAQEDAGSIDTVATTPLVNKTTFVKRVNGIDSPTYLATPFINGLYPKEHFSIVAGLGASPVKNTGWISGLDVGGTVGALATSGDVTSATAAAPTTNDSTVTVNLANAMDDLNYYVRSFIQSEGADLNNDNDISSVVFKPISTTQFQISMREITPVSQSLKIHMEVVQL